jgi:hypothetical protein
MREDSKRCGHCTRTLPYTEFTSDKTRADGLRHNCRECNQAWSRAYYRRASVRQRRDWDLRKTYGLTHDEYDLILEAQGGACALCRRIPKKPLHVDHDHTTGRVRGLLCPRCNQTLGRFGDSIEGLQRVIDYLKERE